MPKAKNKTKGSETDIVTAIPQRKLPRGNHRPILWDSFVYDNGNFDVNTTLRKSQIKNSVAYENRVYTCSIKKDANAPDKTPLSAQLNVVLSAVHRVILKIRKEDAILRKTLGRRGRYLDKTGRMQIRLIPNFLKDPKFHSPLIPLHCNLDDTRGFLQVLFQGLQAAIQSSQDLQYQAGNWLNLDHHAKKEEIDIVVTLIGRPHLATFSKDALKKHAELAKKHYKKNLSKLTLGTPRQIVFAASHLKNTNSALQYVSLRNYHMISESTLLSFPQDPKGPFANGCLLLSILACHIHRMASCSVANKSLWLRRLRRWKRFSRHVLPQETCHHLQRTQQVDGQDVIAENKKIHSQIMRDVVAIFKEIRETLSNYFAIVEDMPLNVWNKKHLKKCLSKGMTLEEILPVCTILSLRIHLISRTREFTCLHSYPNQVDWSLTPIFILIEESAVNSIGNGMVKNKPLPNVGINVYTENQVQYYTKTEGSKGMERKRSKKNKSIIHFTKISRKASEREVQSARKKLNKFKTTFHCSAILNPAVFANQFKDVSYCATCCTFYTGHKADHDCWVPLSSDCGTLLEQCYSQFQNLKDDIQSLAWNIKGLQIEEQKNFLQSR